MPTSMYTEAELKAMYHCLRRAMQDYEENARRLRFKRDPQTSNVLGEFAVKGNYGIVRVCYKHVADCFQELCTLSHELGHARSWLDGLHTTAYHQMLDAKTPLNTLTDPAMKQFVMEEETRAWRTGWKLVQFVGMGDKTAYETEADQALSIYADEMSLQHVPFVI